MDQMESRRSSGSTNSSGRLSTTSLGSAVEALLDTVGDGDNPFDLPIKLPARSDISRSSDQTRVGSVTERDVKSLPTTPHDATSRERSSFISNPMFSSTQDFFNMPAFPPVTSPLSPTELRTALSRKSSEQSQRPTGNSPLSPLSPSRGPELFQDVARLTSLQVEKDRALSRAQDARNKGLATESSSTRLARISNDRRLRAQEANRDLVQAEPYAENGKVDPEIISAMSSFGISFEHNRRPSVDDTLDPLQGDENQDQRRMERQRKRRMRRQLEHERVIRETPIEEYS